MAPRLDVSAVRLQGGYIAKKCPVVIQNRVLVPELEAEMPADALHRAQSGMVFEADLLAGVRTGAGLEWVVIPEIPPVEAIALTVEAMESGVPVIEQAFLPADSAGRRTGKPDLLVLHEDGYIPVDIKHHRTLDDAEETVSVSDPVKPRPHDSYPLEGKTLRRDRGDALQLAHYRRMLEASGYAATSTLAGIIGKELVVVWYDLDEPMWTTPAKSDGKKRKLRSSMERYDFEFGFRLDIAATALQHLQDQSVELLVEPMACGECDSCGFYAYCYEHLEQGAGDSSLLPGLSYQQWRSLRDTGIRDRQQVAALHYPTAQIAREGVDLPTLLGLAGGFSKDSPVADLRPRAKKQIEILGSHGIHSVEDLTTRIDDLTASIGGFIAPKILDARAALGPHPVYRRPGSPGDSVPRADIEIDIDMENVNEGVYLWGALVTDRCGSGEFEEGYVPFFSWEQIDDQKELAIFLSMWDWLSETRSKCRKLGLSIQCYIWHEPAENSQLRRIARNADEHLEGQVEELIQSDQWIDLKGVFNDNWLTGGSAGLKSIAPLGGFTWEVDDPGGALSMVKYAEAVAAEAEVARQAQAWLLAYNRGDVLATREIREWLDLHGSTWPEVDQS